MAGQRLSVDQALGRGLLVLEGDRSTISRALPLLRGLCGYLARDEDGLRREPRGTGEPRPVGQEPNPK